MHYLFSDCCHHKPQRQTHCVSFGCFTIKAPSCSTSWMFLIWTGRIRSFSLHWLLLNLAPDDIADIKSQWWWIKRRHRSCESLVHVKAVWTLADSSTNQNTIERTLNHEWILKKKKKRFPHHKNKFGNMKILRIITLSPQCRYKFS